jgi:hypothetical protein
MQRFCGEPFVTLCDFVEMKEDSSNPGCGCKPHEIGMTDAWQERIVAERGEHYEVPTTSNDGHDKVQAAGTPVWAQAI